MNNLYWGYVHADGSVHLKQYFLKTDIEDAKKLYFVKKVIEPFEATTMSDAYEKMDAILNKHQHNIRKIHVLDELTLCRTNILALIRKAWDLGGSELGSDEFEDIDDIRNARAQIQVLDDIIENWNNIKS